MRKYFFIPAFLLITLPSAIAAWLSLIERIFGEGKAFITFPTSGWYEALFPIVGLAVLLFGIWWTRDKDEGTSPTSLSPSIDAYELEPSRVPKQERSHQPIPETLMSSEAISNAPIGLREEKPIRVSQPTVGEYTQAFPPTLLDIKATDLTAIFTGRTTVQAKPLIDAQIGNMIRVRGNVSDIDETHTGEQCVTIREQTDSIYSDTFVLAHFDHIWAGAIQSLLIDQEVIVLGHIERINKWAVHLESCSLAKGLGV